MALYDVRYLVVHERFPCVTRRSTRLRRRATCPSLDAGRSAPIAQGDDADKFYRIRQPVIPDPLRVDFGECPQRRTVAKAGSGTKRSLRRRQTGCSSRG